MMNKVIKNLTIGTVLGLAVMFSGVGQANANLLGHDIQATFEFPNLGAIIAGPQTETVVDPGVEYPDFDNQGALAIDLTDTLIKVTFLFSNNFLSADFSGLHFVDINNTIPNWAVSVNGGLTTPGLLGGFVTTFTNNDIFLNLEGLTFENGDMIALNVTAAPVPEPSTMLLFGSGLAGIVAWRARKRHA